MGRREQTRARYVVTVELEASNGDRWWAIGGGEALVEAIGFAQESAPAGRDWRVVGVADLYGE